jgi:hypothetical protein
MAASRLGEAAPAFCKWTDLRVLPSHDLAAITLSMECSASAACNLRLLAITSIALPARRRRAPVSLKPTIVSVDV